MLPLYSISRLKRPELEAVENENPLAMGSKKSLPLQMGKHL
jgi:hypothetical protein